MQDDFSATVREIAADEKALADDLDELQKKYPEAFAEINKIDEKKKEIEKRKADIKKCLEEANDYGVHDEDTVRVSLAKIFKVGVEDLDAIPNEYKTVEKGVIVTPKIDWAENELRTRGRLPAGFVDKSYTKFTWRLK